MKKLFFVTLLLMVFFSVNVVAGSENKKMGATTAIEKTANVSEISIKTIWCSDNMSSMLNFEGDDSKCYCRYLYPDGSHCWNRITCGATYCMTHSGFIPGTDSPKK